MKRITTLLCACLLWACSDPLQLAPTANGLAKTDGAATLGLGLEPYEWTSLPMPDPTFPATRNPLANKQFVFAGGTAYWFVGSVLQDQYKLNVRTLQWEKLSGTNEIWNCFFGDYQYLFTKGSRYYAGFRSGGSAYDDLRVIYWYDVSTKQFGQLADFPGELVNGSSFFVYGEKAYLMGGRKGNLVRNHYWEYDFATNQWTDKGGLPGGARTDAVAFVVDDKVYYGLGYTVENLNGQNIKRYKKDWYSMTPGGTVAAARADFPGTLRADAEGFVLNNKVYVGWGASSTGAYLTDFWEFNPATGAWTSKPNCPSKQSGPLNMRAFAVGGSGYFIRGCMGEFWRYGNTPLPIVQ